MFRASDFEGRQDIDPVDGDHLDGSVAPDTGVEGDGDGDDDEMPPDASAPDASKPDPEPEPDASMPAMPDAGVDSGEPLGELPVVVDDHFTPSGRLGPGALAISESSCTSHSDDAVGRCHYFNFDPQAGETWAGVVWLHPDNNWGTEPGYPMPRGAHAVRFVAWTDEGQADIVFGAGFEDYDGFHMETSIMVSREKREVTILLDGAEYTDVVNALSWVTLYPAKFYIDDIRWE